MQRTVPRSTVALDKKYHENGKCESLVVTGTGRGEKSVNSVKPIRQLSKFLVALHTMNRLRFTADSTVYYLMNSTSQVLTPCYAFSFLCLAPKYWKTL